MAEMQSTMKILENIRKNSEKNKDEVFTRLYRYMLRKDLYFAAYRNLYTNNGASTRGVNNDTADGFSEGKINGIIKSLTDETYQPKPARRMYIRKSNGKMRPLGIPTFTDKLIQEVLRMILEAIYEPVFLDYSHGFRSNRSCHTALKDLKHQFHGTRWFVEGDIKGCFDNIDHHKLVDVVGSKLKDARLLKLIWKFLKAGYLEDWQFHGTHSGTPQGGIISPLFANIYLNELDKFISGLAKNFDKPVERASTPEYGSIVRQRRKLSAKIAVAEEPERNTLIGEYKALTAKLLKTPFKSQTDKRIKYIRYADDFLIGVNGDRDDCVLIKTQLSKFIAEELKMELSEEKTLITHSNEYARFLGYDVRVRRNNNTIKHGAYNNVKKRTLNNMTELAIPLDDKIMRFMFEKQIVEQCHNGEVRPIHRKALLRCTDLEIVSTYNAELRGICNYYSMASNFCKLNYFGYLMEYSCLKTLAAKHKCSSGQIKDKYKDGEGSWGIPYVTKAGEKRCYFAKYSECKGTKNASDRLPNEAILHTSVTTTFESRLAAKICELCGTMDAENYEIHHVHKVKDLKGKEHWEKVMIAKRRKTMVLCKNCHYKIHNRVLNEGAVMASRVHREM
jgi:group II intron reverse transcriptase/maturase